MRLRLHHRIAVPFAVVALVATSASAFLAVQVVSREFEARIQRQIVNIADVISRGGFAFTPAIVRSVKAITGADLIAFDEQGTLLSTTVDPAERSLIEEVVSSPLAREARSATAAVRTVLCDGRCFVAYESIPDRPGVVLAVVVEAGETAAAVRAVARTIVLAAVASLVALVLVSQVVARRVTRPLDALVGFTHDVAGGAHGRAAEGDDEVGRLGRSFNEMLDRLEASKSALVRSEKLGLAGLFAARVAHDIRNPLASMKINTQLLEKSGRDPAIVQSILHDISQVESVIRDLIELARPGELRRVPADLNAVIRTVVRQLDARLTHRKVAATLRLPDRLPLVMTDTERLSQALQNVMINAIDAMPHGGALAVSAAADGGSVVIDVDDEGVGIDPALAGRLFDPFVSSKPEGVGLGLVNAKAVVEGHGGAIALTARQPRGTRARITLPAS